MADKSFKVYRYWIDLDGREWTYVGYTGQSLYERAGGLTGINYILCTSKFGFAIETYGWDNFKREILEDNLTEEEAQKREQFYIQKFNSINQGFYYSKGLGHLGRSLTINTKQALSKKLKGRLGPNQGKHWNIESNKKNALMHGVSGINQYDLNGNLLNQFYSLHEAGRQTGISYQSIWRACSGRSKTAGNYKWGYV